MKNCFTCHLQILNEFIETSGLEEAIFCRLAKLDRSMKSLSAEKQVSKLKLRTLLKGTW